MRRFRPIRHDAGRGEDQQSRRNGDAAAEERARLGIVFGGSENVAGLPGFAMIDKMENAG